MINYARSGIRTQEAEANGLKPFRFNHSRNRAYYIIKTISLNYFKNTPKCFAYIIYHFCINYANFENNLTYSQKVEI